MLPLPTHKKIPSLKNAMSKNPNRKNANAKKVPSSHKKEKKMTRNPDEKIKNANAKKMFFKLQRLKIKKNAMAKN